MFQGKVQKLYKITHYKKMNLDISWFSLMSSRIFHFPLLSKFFSNPHPIFSLFLKSVKRVSYWLDHQQFCLSSVVYSFPLDLSNIFGHFDSISFSVFQTISYIIPSDNPQWLRISVVCVICHFYCFGFNFNSVN